jgi:hypothetical protein
MVCAATGQWTTNFPERGMEPVEFDTAFGTVSGWLDLEYMTIRFVDGEALLEISPAGRRGEIDIIRDGKLMCGMGAREVLNMRELSRKAQIALCEMLDA